MFVKSGIFSFAALIPLAFAWGGTVVPELGPDAAADLPARRVLGGIILGEAYNTDIADVVACVKRAGARKETLVLSSHGIHPDAKGINLKTEWLEQILAAAQEADVSVFGFDELPVRNDNSQGVQ